MVKYGPWLSGLWYRLGFLDFPWRNFNLDALSLWAGEFPTAPGGSLFPGSYFQLLEILAPLPLAGAHSWMAKVFKMGEIVAKFFTWLPECGPPQNPRPTIFLKGGLGHSFETKASLDPLGVPGKTFHPWWQFSFNR